MHLSALNIDKSKDSDYANSKMKGENAIKDLFPNSVIVRPSVVFGKRDGFTNLFLKMSNFSPFLPLIGTPEISKKWEFYLFLISKKSSISTHICWRLGFFFNQHMPIEKTNI